MGRNARQAAAGVAVVLSLLGLTACGPGDPSISASRPLYPIFQRAVTDYVNRCDPAEPTVIEVDAPSGTTVSIDGAAPRDGTFEVAVPQAEGERFDITVTSDGSTTTHHVRCLPVDFPAWSAERTGEVETQLYATVLIQLFGFDGSYSALFDKNGVPLWWLERQPTFLFTPLPNGNFATIRFDGVLQEHDLSGAVVRTLETPGGPTDVHDVIVLPNGNYVLATAQNDACDLTSWGLGAATCVNHVFYELTAAGEVVWSWDTAAHIPPEETTAAWRDAEINGDTGPFPTPDLYDPWHYNSVESTGDGLLISFRHLDAVYEVERETGGIRWKLGGTPRPESLTLVGDPWEGVSGQHDARLLADGTVSIYDNGTLGRGPGRPPRRVVYRIDTEARSATMTEELRDDLVPASGCCGSTRLLPGGNRVTGWGGTGYITEHAPDGRRIFTLHTGGAVYRGVPLLPGQYDVDELRAGMDAMYAG